MKKVFAFLLAMMLLTSVACAWAEGTTEETTEEAVEEAAKYPDEITFQDIPWGSSKEEVKSWVKENGFQKVGDDGSFRIAFLDASGKYIENSVGYSTSGIDNFLYAADSDSFQIAGYTIDYLEFSFDIQDGKTELSTVLVFFQGLAPCGIRNYADEEANEQTQAILDDLEQKLITVYGDAVPPMDNSLAVSPEESLLLELLLMVNSDNDSDRYRKVGAENTAICLRDDPTHRVLLIYGKTDVYVAEETNVAPLTIDSFNFDGL